MHNRLACYGYIRDGKKGCRWLDKEPSEHICSSCSFFKSEKEFYAGQDASAKMLKDKGLARITIENKVTTEPDYGDY